MRSPIVKRSVVIADHKTSITLEEPFWNALKEIAEIQGLPIRKLVESIDKERQQANLSSAVRIYILDYYKKLVSN